MKKETLPSIRKRLEQEYTPKMIPIRNILTGINNKSNNILNGKTSQKKFDDLYSLLHKKELLIQAFGNIEKNKGRLTKGINKTTIDGMTLNKIEIISEKLKNKEYIFQPVRRIEVLKPKLLKPGEAPKMRPLGIPTFEDRIVQEAIRIILEAIYEPIFEKSKCNYGFREKKSTHHALLNIKYNATGCNLAIEGDIKGAYDNVDHNTLIEILKKTISDQEFLKFLLHGFKCGLLDQGRYQDTMTGVPQGGIASPILFNIYMQEFDNYIKNELQSEIDNINKNENRTYKPRNKFYDSNQTKLQRLRLKYSKTLNQINKKFVEMTETEKSTILKLRTQIIELDKLKAKTPSIIISKKEIRLLYIRYADDFIIFSNCKMEVAQYIKEKIRNYLKNNLKLELSEEKTIITNIKLKPAKFLGYSIKTYEKRKLSISPRGFYTKTSGWNVIIDVDINRVIDRLKLRGFINLKCKPIAKSPWTVLQPEEIINRYNYMIRGFSNYYFPVIDRLTSINRVIYFFKFSCLSTFAKKYKSKITKITQKYGDPLKLTLTEIQTTPKKTKQIQKTYTLLSYQAVKDLLEYKKFNFKTYQEKNIYPNPTDIFRPLRTINWRTYKNLENVCAICGTDKNVEQHHIKHIKVGQVTGFSQVMKQLNRKMIPLCRTHHVEVEHGKYDNIKLEDLIDIQRFLA